jgi:DNA-binding IclR family transcriptional regulator
MQGNPSTMLRQSTAPVAMPGAAAVATYGPPARSPDTGTVARTIAVLRVVAESGGGTQIKRISAALGLPGSTVHRLLDLLMREGMVERDEDTPTYRIGREFFRLASVVVDEYPLPSIAEPYLAEAVAAVNETAYLCLYLPREQRLSFASHRESTHPLGYRVRSHEPQSLITGASGRSILAWLPADVRAAVLAREPAAAGVHTSPDAYAAPDLSTLEHDLQAIRARGYALSFGQRIFGAVGIFAPVFGASAQVTGSLGFTIPEQRYDAAREQEFAGCACRLAAGLSASLGHRAARDARGGSANA